MVSNSAEWDPNNICMSLTSLVGGLVMLLGDISKLSHALPPSPSFSLPTHAPISHQLSHALPPFSGVLVVASMVASFMHCQMRKKKTKKVPQ